MTARRRILIVDDETRVAFFLQESLESRGYDFKVTSVASTAEALRQISQQRFDLLVIDQRMPEMTGLELIQKAQKDDPDIRFILITAYGSDKVLDQAQQLGAFHCFTKPFHIEDFVQTVVDALEPDRLLGEPTSDQHINVLNGRLEELRREVGAQCVLASVGGGASIARAGVLTGLDEGQLLRLAADGFASSLAMTRYLGGNHASNLNYYEGAKYDIYTASVHDDLFLVIVFDRRVQASRLGIVWLYTRRAIESLRRLMALTAFEASAPIKKSIGLGQKQRANTLRNELLSIDQPVT